MSADAALWSLAFLLTYLLHSTLILAGVWLLLRVRVVRSLAMENNLWRLGLVGGLLTSGLQSGLGFEPWSGHLPISGAESAPAVALRDVTVRPTRALPGATPRRSHVSSTLPERALPGTDSRVWVDALSSRATNETARVGLPEVSHAVQIELEHEARHALATLGATTSSTGAAATPLRPRWRPEPTTPAPVRSTASGRLPTWTQLAFGLWAILSIIGLARFVGLRLQLRRTLAGRRDVRDPALLQVLDELRRTGGLRRPVRLTTSPLITGPIALGRNEICLPPRALCELAPQRLEAVLAHELAHLVRRDPLWLNLAALVEVLVFFQPLNRIASRRMQETAEFLCDDWAVSRTGRGLVLAHCLAQVASWMEDDRRALPVAGMAQSESTLVRRVRRLTDASVHRGVVRPARVGLVGVLLLGAVSCSVPGITAEGQAGFLARFLMAWSDAGKAGPQPASDVGGQPQEIALQTADETPVTLIVVDGQVVGARLDGRELTLDDELLDGDGAPRVALVDERGRPLLILQVGAADDLLEWDEDEPDGEEWDAEDWDAEESWDGEEWEEPWEEEDENEPRWDSRSLLELSTQVQQLEREYAQRHQQLSREFDQGMQQFQREAQAAQQHSSREFEQQVQRWNQQHQQSQSQRQGEWQQETQAANQSLQQIQRECRTDPRLYRERFAEWREHYDEMLEEHESKWRDWDDEHRSEYDEALESYESEQYELQHHWSDGQEEILAERLDAFAELEEWFSEAYWELREGFDARISDRRGRPCDHGCRDRCSNGCTHPDDPEPRPDPRPEPRPDPCPEPCPRPDCSSEHEPDTEGVVKTPEKRHPLGLRHLASSE